MLKWIWKSDVLLRSSFNLEECIEWSKNYLQRTKVQFGRPCRNRFRELPWLVETIVVPVCGLGVCFPWHCDGHPYNHTLYVPTQPSPWLFGRFLLPIGFAAPITSYSTRISDRQTDDSFEGVMQNKILSYTPLCPSLKLPFYYLQWIAYIFHKHSKFSYTLPSFHLENPIMSALFTLTSLSL